MPTEFVPEKSRPSFGGAPVGQHYVCLACRVAFKGYSCLACPNCGGPLYGSGLAFRTPRKGAKRQWRVVSTLLQHGLSYPRNHGGYRRPAPRTPREAKEAVRRAQRRVAGELGSFLENHPRQRMPKSRG